MYQVVIDTNVLVAALLSSANHPGGAPIWCIMVS